MTKKETEMVVSKKDEALAVKELIGDMQGCINVRAELLKIPRVKLTQKMSNVFGQLAEEGDFASEVLGINYGPTLTIIPINISESASLMDKKTNTAKCWSRDLLKNSEGILCKDCPYNEYWADWNKKQPGCATSIDMICLLMIDNEIGVDPIEMNFRKMNSKAGRSILNMAIRDPLGVPFGSSYILTSKKAKKDQYEFFIINDVIEKKACDAETIKKIIPIAKSFLEMKKRGLIAHEAPIADGEIKEEEISPDTPTEDCPL